MEAHAVIVQPETARPEARVRIRESASPRLEFPGLEFPGLESPGLESPGLEEEAPSPARRPRTNEPLLAPQTTGRFEGVVFPASSESAPAGSKREPWPPEPVAT